MDTAIVVFTRDLRVHDNPALALACAAARQVVPVFVADPALTVPPNRGRFLAQSVGSLRGQLRKRGGDLVIRHGDPVAEVMRIAAGTGAQAVFIADDVSRYAALRRVRLEAACARRRLQLTITPGHAVVQAGMVQQAPVSAVTVAGCAVWLIGFFFEAVGDWQLTRFRADPANRGRIMDRGLWRYTRHPNYFGDACMWWGLFGTGYGSAVQLVTVVSPLLMTFILTRGTGQRLTDRRMAQTRPDYAEYAARTSGFIPLPPGPPRRVLPDGYRDRGLHP